MKHFSDYILEKQSLSVVPILEDADGNIIVEGFWKKLGSLFGFGAGKMQKLSDKMQKWSDDFKNAFAVSQYMAAQSKQDNISKLMSDYVDAIAQGGDAPLKFLKERAKEIVEKPELVKDKNVSQVYLGFMKNLNELSTNAKDEEGTGLAKKGAGVISKQNSDIEGEYTSTSKKVEKVEDGPTNADTEGGKKAPKPEEAAKETIEEQTNVLEPLYKTLGDKVKADNLTKIVTDLIEKSGYLDGHKSKSDGSIIPPSEEAKNANILGMSVIICGALMMSSGKALKSVAEYLTTNSNKITNALQVKQLNLS